MAATPSPPKEYIFTKNDDTAKAKMVGLLAGMASALSQPSYGMVDRNTSPIESRKVRSHKNKKRKMAKASKRRNR